MQLEASESPLRPLVAGFALEEIKLPGLRGQRCFRGPNVPNLFSIPSEKFRRIILARGFRFLSAARRMAEHLRVFWTDSGLTRRSDAVCDSIFLAHDSCRRANRAAAPDPRHCG